MRAGFAHKNRFEEQAGHWTRRLLFARLWLGAWQCQKAEKSHAEAQRRREATWWVAGALGYRRSSFCSSLGLKVAICELGVAKGLAGLLYQCMTQPPSMLMVWPVMVAACGEARKAMVAAIWSGVCHWPRGHIWRTLARPHWS